MVILKRRRWVGCGTEVNDIARGFRKLPVHKAMRNVFDFYSNADIPLHFQNNHYYVPGSTTFPLLDALTVDSVSDLTSHTSRQGIPKINHNLNRVTMSNISPLIICMQGFKVSFGEISLTMMHFRSQRWLASYALLPCQCHRECDVPEAEESEAIAQSSSWLHAGKSVSKDQENEGHFFAPPLLPFKCLRNGSCPAKIQPFSLLEFVSIYYICMIQVIKHFSPLNLSHPQVGPYHYFQTLLEAPAATVKLVLVLAQYQDEFYRCFQVIAKFIDY